jgi:hypothetical protein
MQYFRHLMPILFVLLIGTATLAIQNKPLVGVDYLALQSKHWKCQQSLDVLPNRIALGTLHGSFGSDLSCVEQFYKSGKVSIHRVHSENGPGLNNNNLGRHEWLYGYTIHKLEKHAKQKNPRLVSRIVEVCSKYIELAKPYGVEVWCSPVLEHVLSVKAFNNLADAVQERLPGITIVNSPRDTHRARGYVIERHGKKARAPIVSADGDVRPVFSNYLRRNPQALIVFQWHPSYNGRKGLKFTPIKQRRKFSNLKQLRKYSRPLFIE